MRKLFQILSRTALTFGVLLALTPCAECQMNRMEQAAASCPMAKAGHPMDCCHTHEAHNPFCRVMNQSSVSVQAAQVDAPALLPLLPAFRAPQLTAAFQVAPAFTFPVSPPRSSPVLRI